MYLQSILFEHQKLGILFSVTKNFNNDFEPYNFPIYIVGCAPIWYTCFYTIYIEDLVITNSIWCLILEIIGLLSVGVYFGTFGSENTKK